MCNGCNTGNGGCGFFNTLFNGCSQRVCRDGCGNLRIVGGCGCSGCGTSGCGGTETNASSFGCCSRSSRCGCWQTTTQTTDTTQTTNYYSGCCNRPCGCSYCNG